MISQTAEYALRAVLYLAAHSEAPQTIPIIARATEVPAGYLSKVLQTLRRAGLVASQRGKKGGFILIRQPQDLTLFDVVNAITPMRRMERCPLSQKANCSRVHNGGGAQPGLCPQHTVLNDVYGLVEGRLQAFSVSSFLPPAASPPAAAD